MSGVIPDRGQGLTTRERWQKKRGEQEVVRRQFVSLAASFFDMRRQYAAALVAGGLLNPHEVFKRAEELTRRDWKERNAALEELSMALGLGFTKWEPDEGPESSVDGAAPRKVELAQP